MNPSMTPGVLSPHPSKHNQRAPKRRGPFLQSSSPGFEAGDVTLPRKRHAAETSDKENEAEPTEPKQRWRDGVTGCGKENEASCGKVKKLRRDSLRQGSFMGVPPRSEMAERSLRHPSSSQAAPPPKTPRQDDRAPRGSANAARPRHDSLEPLSPVEAIATLAQKLVADLRLDISELARLGRRALEAQQRGSEAEGLAKMLQRCQRGFIAHLETFVRFLQGGGHDQSTDAIEGCTWGGRARASLNADEVYSTPQAPRSACPRDGPATREAARMRELFGSEDEENLFVSDNSPCGSRPVLPSYIFCHDPAVPDSSASPPEKRQRSGSFRQKPGVESEGEEAEDEESETSGVSWTTGVRRAIGEGRVGGYVAVNGKGQVVRGSERNGFGNVSLFQDGGGGRGDGGEEDGDEEESEFEEEDESWSSDAD